MRYAWVIAATLSIRPCVTIAAPSTLMTIHGILGIVPRISISVLPDGGGSRCCMRVKIFFGGFVCVVMLVASVEMHMHTYLEKLRNSPEVIQDSRGRDLGSMVIQVISPLETPVFEVFHSGKPLQTYRLPYHLQSFDRKRNPNIVPLREPLSPLVDQATLLTVSHHSRKLYIRAQSRSIVHSR